MTKKKIGNQEYSVKENGKIDFERPPKGKVFVPVPTDEEDIRRRGIDRRFVTRHKFSATTLMVVMELVDEEYADKVKAYIAAVKCDCKREERKVRCRIQSPKTGKMISCPDSISCYSGKCPKEQGIQVEEGRPISLDIDGMEETVKSCVYTNDPTADEAITNCMWDSFVEKLNKENHILAFIAEADAKGYGAIEILNMLGKTETEKSWFYRQKEKIRNRWIKYNVD